MHNMTMKNEGFISLIGAHMYKITKDKTSTKISLKKKKKRRAQKCLEMEFTDFCGILAQRILCLGEGIGCVC